MRLFIVLNCQVSRFDSRYRDDFVPSAWHGDFEVYSVTIDDAEGAYVWRSQGRLDATTSHKYMRASMKLLRKMRLRTTMS